MAVTATGLEPTITYFVNEHSTIWKKRRYLLVPKLQYCQFEQSEIAEKNRTSLMNDKLNMVIA